MSEVKKKIIGAVSEDIRIVSCDVFDTLLLRDHRSERRRFRDIAALVAAQLVISQQILREPGLIYDVRHYVQREAYRVLDLVRPQGDVRFAEMVDAMAQMLSLDDAGARILHDAELAIELSQLRPNRPLLDWLSAQATEGRRIIAISDTYHSAQTVMSLLDALAPNHPIATVYSSADLDATKRSGALFSAVLRAERIHPSAMLHIGDDPVADVAMPRAAGLSTRNLVRPALLRLRRKLDAAATRAICSLQWRGAPATSGGANAEKAAAQRFGEQALGPIFADFCMRLWLHQRFLPEREDATLLFCARGGLRLRLLYQRFLERSGLPPLLPDADLMISRVVAARTSVDHPGEALLAELGREFQGRPMAEIAAALAQRDDLALPEGWRQPFEARRFVQLLAATDAGTLELRRTIAAQDELFRDHLDRLVDGRSRAILCDTGLYGSTVRLLREGIPEKRWLCLQFARSNYKRLATPHFDCTRGLVVESDSYKPWLIETSALRFWQLIEAVLEPPLPSVTSFVRTEPGAAPLSNLEVEDWRLQVDATGEGLFAGALNYIDKLDASAPMQIAPMARIGWRRFRRAVIWPDRTALAALRLDDRPRDFGRSERVAQFAGAMGMRQALQRVRMSLWREGAVLHFFPRTGRLGLVLLELSHTLRALRERRHPRSLPNRLPETEPPLPETARSLP